MARARAAHYTLMMVDPDAPDPAEPVRRQRFLVDGAARAHAAGPRGRGAARATVTRRACGCAQTYRNWLHWLVVDIPGRAGLAAGRTLTPYKGPSPPAGVHRYTFLVFKQRIAVGAARAAQLAPPERNDFDVRAFAAANKLSAPQGSTLFTVAHSGGAQRHH
jgi:phosphatidylethanolamine-binding protein (PEBP) family uncharacterized protein